MPLPKGYTVRIGTFGKTWDPKLGGILEGELVNYREKVGPNGQDCATIQDQGGTLHAVWITANFEGRITKSDIGKRFYLERVADTPMPAGRSPMKTYDVGV